MNETAEQRLTDQAMALLQGDNHGYISNAPRTTVCRRKLLMSYYDQNGDYQEDCGFNKSKLLALQYQYSTKDNSWWWWEMQGNQGLPPTALPIPAPKGDDVENRSR